MTSKEALDNIIAKYDWLGKEYCRLIGKGENLHKVNQETFEELANTIKQDLERLETLEMENEELKARLDLAFMSYKVLNKLTNDQHEIIKNLTDENEKLKKAIALLKLMFNFEVDVETETIYCCLGDVSISGANLIQDFELLKEVLGNE